MQRRTFLSTVSVVGATVALSPRFSLAQQPSQKLDLATILSITEVPGIAIAGIIRGRPVTHLAGVRAVGSPEPITVNTYFSAASLTKPVFAWAVRELTSQGKIDLKKPLQDYTNLGLSGDAARITAEHVLSHQTGLPNWRFQPNVQLATEFAPGTRWQYSGEGIFLLQRVVEKIAGLPIAQYMKQAVLEPLGMTASTFAWTPELRPKSAAGHSRRANLLERDSAFYEQRNFDVIRKAGLQPESSTYEQIARAYEQAKASPLPITMSPNMAGSLNTTAADYSKFLKAVLADIPRHADGYRPRVRVNPQISWALGWGVDDSVGQSAYFHWGDGPGFKNFAWVHPATNTAVVFFTNGDHGQSAYSLAFRKLVGQDPASQAWI